MSLILPLLLICAEAAPADDGIEERRKEAVQRAIAFLREQQNADGTWTTKGILPHFRVGVTALCTAALLEAGLDPDDPAIEKAITRLRQANLEKTYEVALLTIVFARVGPKPDLKLIQHYVDWLQAGQIVDGQHVGAWTYTPDGKEFGFGDLSNTGFALWALDEAARVGAKVNAQTWERSLRFWAKHQNEDGSWQYHAEGNGRGGMTCAGISSVLLCSRALAESGSVVDADDSKKFVRTAATWLEKHFTATREPNGDSLWTFHFLMQLRRTCNAGNRNMIGTHDWYAKGVAFLLTRQDRRTGSWHGEKGPEQNPILSTAFALLFLRQLPKFAE